MNNLCNLLLCGTISEHLHNGTVHFLQLIQCRMKFFQHLLLNKVLFQIGLIGHLIFRITASRRTLRRSRLSISSSSRSAART